MCRQVLLTGRGIELLTRAMVGVSKHRAGHVVGVEKVRGFVSVIDRQKKTPLKPAANLGDPITRLQADFGVLSLLECDPLYCEIFRNGARRKSLG